MQNRHAEDQTVALPTEPNVTGGPVTTEGRTNATAPRPRGTLFFFMGGPLPNIWELYEGTQGYSVFLYTLSRVTLVVVAFWNLSSMPETIHQSLEWLNFVPHL
jgi:hypothetical protein